MVSTQKRRTLCTVLLALNIAFIWGNSLLPGAISAAISDGVKLLLQMLLGAQEGTTGGGLLRKLAHFGEFATLGVLLRWQFGMLLDKPWQQYGLPFCIGVAVAAVDETIQLFVPDRGPHIKDVGIDTLGLALGIFIISLFTHIKKKRMKENVL